MAGINIPISANFDQGDLERSLQQMQQRLNALGQQIAQSNKVKFSPIDKTSIEDLSRFTAQFENLRKISSSFDRRLKQTGQGGVAFLDIDWNKMYADAGQRSRQMQKAFEYVTGAGFGPASAGGGGGGGGRMPHQPPPWKQQGSNIVGAGLGAAGPAGRVASGALSTGMAAGVGAGMIGLLGGLAALAVGKAVGAVRERVGASEQEYIGYDTLKRAMGDVNVSFNTLKKTIQGSANAIQVNFAEAQRLATSFARLSNATDDQAKSLGDEVRIGGGMSRSLGVDPSQGVGFMGRMRLFGATQDESGSRRMALIVGETIARSRSFAKSDEILQTIADYTQQQTRLGLNTANVAGYSAYLGSAVGSGIPGLDPGGAANLLGRVNTSISGGMDGKHSIFYSLLGRQMGLNSLEMGVLLEGGAFGTGASAFGEGSVYSGFASRHGLHTPGVAGDGSTMNIERVMGAVRARYGNDPMTMANAMSNLYGINYAGAMALDGMKPSDFSGLNNRLGRLGVSDSINPTAYGLLGQIEVGNEDELAKIARNFGRRRSLSEDEQRGLDAAWSSGDDGAIRDTLARLAAKYGQEETEGDKTRATIAGVENAISSFSEKLVPVANAMRAGIMHIAGGGKKTPEQIMKELAETEHKARVGDIRSRYGSIAHDLAENKEKAKWELRDGWRNRAERLQEGKWSTDDERAWQVRRSELEIASDQIALHQSVLARMKERDELIARENQLHKDNIESMEKEAAARRQAEADAAATKIAPLSSSGVDVANRFQVGGRRFGAAPVTGGTGPASPVTLGGDSIVNPGLMGKRGFRNNNPGNIEASGRFKGIMGSDGRFGVYDTPENGYRAIGKQLQAYQRRGINTVRSIISTWAPKGENNTEAYINRVAAELGVSPDAVIDVNDPNTAFALTRAITRHENGGLAHNDSVMWGGVNSAIGREGGTPMPSAPAREQAGGGEKFGQSAAPLHHSFNIQLGLTGDAARMFNPPAPITGSWGSPVPSGLREFSGGAR